VNNRKNRDSLRRLFAGIVVVISMADCSAGGFCLKAKADNVRKQLVSQLKPGDARKMADVALKFPRFFVCQSAQKTGPDHE